jgi:hypothetical protein
MMKWREAYDEDEECNNAAALQEFIEQKKHPQ